MRNIIITLSFLAITATSFAGNNREKTFTAEQKLDYAIQNQIAAPNFLTERPGMHSAEVHFTVNADGSITVKDISSSEQDLKENLQYQIKSFIVNTAGLDLKDTYKIVLRFNIL